MNFSQFSNSSSQNISRSAIIESMQKKGVKLFEQ